MVTCANKLYQKYARICTCSIETVCAVHADHVQWLLPHEPVHNLNKRSGLLRGGRLAVATALHLVVLGALRFDFTTIIEARRVGQIDPESQSQPVHFNKTKDHRWLELTFVWHLGGKTCAEWSFEGQKALGNDAGAIARTVQPAGG